MATRLLRINSKFRETAGSSADFKVIIPVSDLDNVEKITLLSASIPRMFGNVYPGISIIRWYQGSVPPQILEVVIPDGQYTAEELAIVLDGRLPLTVTYTDGRFFFQNSTADSINLLPSSDTLLSYLGIVDGLNITAGTTEPAPFPPQLQGPLAIYVQSNAIANNSCLDVLANGLALPVVVPINISAVPYGFNIGWVAPTTEEWLLRYSQFPDGQTLRNIDIRFCDVYGNVLNLPENAYSDLVFKIYYSPRNTTNNY